MRRRYHMWSPYHRGTGLEQARFIRHNVHHDWRHLVFWHQQPWKDIQAFIQERRELGYDIHPFKDKKTWSLAFRPLLETSLKNTRIVIIGQDPYLHGEADGLAFSVKSTRKRIPQTLRRIFYEYIQDLGFAYPRSGDLSTWARNGILLFNCIWTVEDSTPKSHLKINGKNLWGELTAEIIQTINKRKQEKVVFILWGRQANNWRYLIDEDKHVVISSMHPSPRNNTRPNGKNLAPFIGSKPFSRACDILKLDRRIWRLP